MSNITTEEYDVIESAYQRYEPYQYFKIYLDMGVLYRIQSEKKPDQMLRMMKHPEQWSAYQSFIDIGSVGMKIPEGKIIRLDDDLIPLLEDTKPDYNDLKLKFPSFFVNHNITVGKFKINGFMVVDVEQIKEFHPELNFESTTQPEGKLRVLSVILNTKDKYEFYSIQPFHKNVTKIKDDKDGKDMNKMCSTINKIACNLVNLLVNDEKNIEYVDVKATNNVNRKKRGKPLQRDVMFMRLGGSLKRYATYYSQFRNKSNVRYFVGGYWRRFTSNFYKHMQGKKIWVKSFYRNMDADEESIPKFINITKAKK